MTDSLEKTTLDYGTRINQLSVEAASTIAQHYSIPVSVAYARLYATFTKPAAVSKLNENDARLKKWYARIMLYRGDGYSEPEADTDNDLPPGQRGTTVIPGLTGVADFLAELAAQYHAGQPVTGLEPDVLRKSLESLRPTLSRHRKRGDESAVWRVDYVVGAQPWCARVEVERVVTCAASTDTGT